MSKSGEDLLLGIAWDYIAEAESSDAFGHDPTQYFSAKVRHLFDDLEPEPGPDSGSLPSDESRTQGGLAEAWLTDEGLAENDDWRKRGLCTFEDPEMFFPTDLETFWAAKKICQLCEVRVVCLNYALETKQDTGVWGGLGEGERRQLRQKSA